MSSKEKSTTIDDTRQRREYDITPQEKEANQLALERQRALQPGLLEIGENQTNAINALLTGQNLPGQLGGLFPGISPELTAEMSQEAIKDLMPQFQQAGVLDSGAAASIAGRTAGDIRRQSAESNLQRQYNLLALGLGQGAGQQQLGTQGLGQLGQQLASGRNYTNIGTGSVTALGMNPFWRSFQSGLGTQGASVIGGVGKTLSGGRSFSYGPISMGGTGK